MTHKYPISFADFFESRFGLLLSGKHEADGQACALEALNAYHEREWSDSPSIARTFDLRPLNDAGWSSDALRTDYLIPVLVALDGSLNWPRERQQAFVETVIRRTVNEIISALPSLPDAVREQCRAANTMAECKAAAADAAARAAAADAILILACDIWCEAAQEN